MAMEIATVRKTDKTKTNRKTRRTYFLFRDMLVQHNAPQ